MCALRQGLVRIRLRGHLEPTLRVVLADVSPLGIAGVRTGLAGLIE